MVNDKLSFLIPRNSAKSGKRSKRLRLKSLIFEAIIGIYTGFSETNLLFITVD